MAIFDKINKKVSTDIINKEAKNISQLDSAIRPLLDEQDISNKNRAFNQLSTFGFRYITLYDLYALSKYADILQVIFNAINRETFRNGIEIESLYDNSSIDQRNKIEEFINKCNENGQTLIEVLQEFSRDLDWADDGYVLVTKDYYYVNDEIIGGEVKEVMRLDPLSVDMMLDYSNRLGRDEKGNIVYTSLNNRTLLTKEPIDKVTGKKNIIAHYRVRTSKGYMYYNSSEIIHKSAYNPSITYGYSPLFSLYNKTLILLGQDYYIKKYYTSDKPIKGMLAFNTNNWDGLKKVLDQIEVEKKSHPHKVFPIPFNNLDNRKPIEYIDMSRSLQEMQFIEGRNELRNQIGAMYGVSPIFQNDNSTSGGLNNEGLQITVTNRAIESRQSLIKYVLDFIFKKNMGITTFDIYLRPSEEQDEAHELDLEAKKIANAKAKLELGLKGSLNEDGEFIFIEGNLELQKAGNEFIPFMNSDKSGEVDVVTPVDITKENKNKQLVNKSVRSETKKFKTNLEKELEKAVSKLDFKSKPSESELQFTVKEIVDNLSKQLKIKSSNRVKSIYIDAQKQLANELNKKFSLTKQDKNVIEFLKKNPTFTTSIKNFSNDMTNTAMEIIKNAFENPQEFTIDKITEKLKQNLDEKNSKLKTIARTESAKISMAGRKLMYDKTGENYKYYHIGVIDNRTSETTKEMIKLTKEGVTWDEYINLAKSVSKQYNPKWELNELTPILHPNQRSKFIARRV